MVLEQLHLKLLPGAIDVIFHHRQQVTSASVSFTSGMDSTYDVYIFKYLDLNPATDGADFTFQGSTDGGSTDMV